MQCSVTGMSNLIIATSSFQSQVSDLLPCNNSSKSCLTYALLKSYGLLHCFDRVIENPWCTRKDMEQFHESEYLDVLLDEKYDSVLDGDEDESSWSHIAQLAVKSPRFCDNFEKSSWFTTRKALYSYYTSEIQSEGYTNDKRYTSGNKRSRWEALIDDECSSDSEDNESLNSHTKSFLKERQQQIILNQTRGKLEKLGLLYDCPIFSYLPMYCQVITGATLSLLKFLRKDLRTIAINWDGGRHHSFKSRASGFCYINDIVLAIQKLRRNFSNISYVDFDLHHGDGVERAFQYSKNVQTISLHNHEPGFFPGTGSMESSQDGHSIINIPLRHGADDDCLMKITESVVIPCIQKHRPQVIVIQCGGDGLIGDKYEEWQLTIRGLTSSILKILSSLPDTHIILLGGGGYNDRVMSRFYTYLTWKVCDQFSKSPPEDPPFIDDEDLIPDHEFLDLYTDEHYKFWIYELEGGKRKTLKNLNTKDHINAICKRYNV